MAPADILGTWSLTAYESYHDDVLRGHPLGDEPVGQLMYSGDGWMSAILAKATRPTLSVMPFARAPVDERADALLTFFAYGGTWRIDGDRVRHQCRYCTVPNYTNVELVRHVELNGDVIALTSEPSTSPSGRVVVERFTWVRSRARSLT